MPLSSKSPAINDCSQSCAVNDITSKINNKIIFICGSDEHGAAITLRAKKENKRPKEIVDFYHNLNKKCFEKLNIDFDIYDRTSSKLHHKTASEFFTKLNEKIFRGSPDTVKNQILKNNNNKGEFVIVVEGIDLKYSNNIELKDLELEIDKLLNKFSLTDVVEIVHKMTKLPKNKIYKNVLDIKNG